MIDEDLDAGRVGGVGARRALLRVLHGESSVPPRFVEPLYERVARAVLALRRHEQSTATPSGLDLAVLFRQVLRYEAAQSTNVEGPSYTVPLGADWPTTDDWHRAGVVLRDGVNLVGTPTVRLREARPWLPTWLDDVGPDGVEGRAMALVNRRESEPVAGDPFLRAVGNGARRVEYRSAGQRGAIRAALTAPPGSTLLVCLPTGEGKSLVFQVVASVGYAGEAGKPGLVVVVVPTIALALDHERSLYELGYERRPYAYVSGDEDRRSLIRESIVNGSQGIVLTSPEAVCRSLRWPLERAASSGRLGALVVDEAHIVDQWGADFRPDFQVLAGVRRALLAKCNGPRFRTFLLSATLTEGAVDTLFRLYGPNQGEPGQPGIVSAAQLRPESEYWVAPISDPETRRQRGLEALNHLPRPAILYTTRVCDAKAWHSDLQHAGFQRIALVHGDTSASDRALAIEGWRNRTIDLIVATSAFGLGIDNPEVRTVVHACIPETLDRFYQEVGRGGRDGRAANSLLLPSLDDWNAARALNRRTLIDVELGLERWASMFTYRDRIYESASDRIPDGFAVRTDGPGGLSGERRFMMGPLSDRWHLQTLNLMANAGLLELRAPAARQARRGEDDEVASDGHRYQLVRLLEPRLIPPTGPRAQVAWAERVQAIRKEYGKADDLSLEQMRRFLGARTCASDSVAPLYEVPGDTRRGSPAISVSRACGGCPACRADGRDAWSGWPAEPTHPWAPPTLDPGLTRLLGARLRLFVFYPDGQLGSGRAPAQVVRRARTAFGRLIRAGLKQIILVGDLALDATALAQEATTPCFFAQSGDFFERGALPHGPILTVVGPGSRLDSLPDAASEPSELGEVFVLPADYPAPNRITSLLIDVTAEKQLTLDQLVHDVENLS